MQPLLMVVALFALVLGTVVPFIVRAHNMMPNLISVHGKVIDDQIVLTMYITGVIFSLAQIALAWMIWKYQSKGQKATYVHGNALVEWASIFGSGVLFVGLNLMGQGVWADMHLKDEPKGSTEIEVNGQQYKWYYRYPGNDGKFGERSPSLVDDTSQNYLGVDFENDKYAKDDVVEGTLRVPYGRDIVVLIRSRDVIHSFFVRELRVKQDAVPGLEIKIPFKIDHDGMLMFKLAGVAASTLDAKDDSGVNAVKAQFEEHGIAVDTSKAKIKVIETPKKRWELSTVEVSHYDAKKEWTVRYSIEEEIGELKVYKTTYESPCAELCGNGHYTMRGEMEVLSPEEYDAWAKKASEDAKSYH
ncbi:MAG: cytochrome c oxidase subunit II [Planctomycetes bacterium]|nr:cytochrome c oxidase subunit II [Planctomycetota bacterium]